MVLGIYSYKYTLVSLHFTNWLISSLLLKSLPKLQSEPSLKIITVELGKILRLLHLFLDQYLDSRKVLKVFVICNNIDQIGQTL